MADHDHTRKVDSQRSADTEDRVFNPGQAEWVSEEAERELDEDQRALLLALAQLEAELGRPLSDVEMQALDALGDQLEAFDASEITRAIHQMVNTPSDPDRQTSWSELQKRRG